MIILRLTAENIDNIYIKHEIKIPITSHNPIIVIYADIDTYIRYFLLKPLYTLIITVINKKVSIFTNTLKISTIKNYYRKIDQKYHNEIHINVNTTILQLK